MTCVTGVSGAGKSTLVMEVLFHGVSAHLAGRRKKSTATAQILGWEKFDRVIAIDLSDPAFEPGTTEIRLQWRSRLDVLLQELRKAPAVLRLCYVADTEDAALVQQRVEAVKRQLVEAWGEGDYPLTIEPEIFWRLGGPPKLPKSPPQSDGRAQDGR